MKKNTTISILAILLTGLILDVGCKKKSDTTVATGPVPVVVTGNYNNLLPTSVDFTGSITNDGGSFVKQRGFCWSSSIQIPTINNDTVESGVGAGSFSGIIPGLKNQTLYYVRAFASNGNGTGYGSTLAVTTIPYSIGLYYEGGIIFYLDVTGEHGLIAATSDQSSGTIWGCFGTLIGLTGTDIGKGKTSTQFIINGCSTAGTAAQICYFLVMNGYSDWFLPSKDELNQMYIQRNVIGGFSNNSYWSSSEYDANLAWNQYLNDGSVYGSNKNNVYSVRPVRAF
jgi:hypothetical protein